MSPGLPGHCWLGEWLGQLLKSIYQKCYAYLKEMLIRQFVESWNSRVDSKDIKTKLGATSI